jgi:hypothetical protein
MAVMESSYRAPKALRMYLEQVVPTEREIAALMQQQRDDRQLRWEAAQRKAEHDVHELASAVGADPHDIVWVDHPTDGGR